MHLILGPIEQTISTAMQTGRCLLAVLVDPDKSDEAHVAALAKAASPGPDLWLCGGSLLSNGHLETCINNLRQQSKAPIVIFPGDTSQISATADALLLLSLISGRNADLLIGRQVQSAFALQHSKLELLPCGYILIDSGRPTTVSYMSQTQPIPANKPDIVAATALAGVQLGLRHIYLEGGSGAQNPVPVEAIARVRKHTSACVWVGGGIGTPAQARAAAQAGAHVVVIGTAAEQSPSVLKEIRAALADFNGTSS